MVKMSDEVKTRDNVLEINAEVSKREGDTGVDQSMPTDVNAVNSEILPETIENSASLTNELENNQNEKNIQNENENQQENQETVRDENVKNDQLNESDEHNKSGDNLDKGADNDEEVIDVSNSQDQLTNTGDKENHNGKDEVPDEVHQEENNQEIINEHSPNVQNGDIQEPKETLDINENNEKNRPQSVISVDIVEKKSNEPSQDGNPVENGPNPGEVERDNSFIKAVENEAKKVEEELAPSKAANPGKKKMKKGIFISYSPDAGFLERRFIVELVRQLKDNSLSEDIWFDKDEKNTDSPCWFSLRMEAVERCRAAILVVSDSYFMCPVSVYEGKALLLRQMADPSSAPKVHMVLFSDLQETDIPRQYNHLLSGMVDLTGIHSKKSLAEKTSVVIGSLMSSLEESASILTPAPLSQLPDSDFTGEYKKKKISQWSPVDIQEWLFHLGIKEFFRQCFGEMMVDGFLLMAMTDNDMVQYLGIYSNCKVVRKKIMQSILKKLDEEIKLSDNWHLIARTQRSKANTVYLIYDPADKRLAMTLKNDLRKKGLQIIHHQVLGQSKEEFLQLNGPTMAKAQYVLVIFTEATGMSPFVFHEVMFADWLGKKLIVAMFKNTWNSLRSSLKAVLGDCSAIDFETKLYEESLGVLEHHIKPIRSIPGVILEQSYLNKMADGFKPFGVLATTLLEGQSGSSGESPHNVFISYQWDMQSKISEVRHELESHGFHCWADISPAMSSQNIRGGSSISSRCAAHIDTSETLQTQIQRNMKAASVVICCITPKYMQSDNCIKDLTLAETLHKPVLPIMLRFCPWPPEGAPIQVKKFLARLVTVDLSNEKLFKKNIPVVLDKVKALSHLPIPGYEKFRSY